MEARTASPPQPRADMDFELEFFSPTELRAHPKYREQVKHMLDAANTTTYAVATCQTRKGPFVCILPLDGRVAMRTPNLAKLLVEEAQRELAREFAELN
jgi:hypothetical protein